MRKVDQAARVPPSPYRSINEGCCRASDSRDKKEKGKEKAEESRARGLCVSGRYLFPRCSISHLGAPLERNPLGLASLWRAGRANLIAVIER